MRLILFTAIFFFESLAYAGINPPQLPSQSGNSGKVLGTNGSTLSWVTGGGGGGTPGGATGAIQFNNAGAFGGDAANFFFDNTNKRIGIMTNAPTVPIDYVMAAPGTISGGATVGDSKVVTGSGTTFTTTFKVGDLFIAKGNTLATQSFTDTIATITSDTSITLTNGFTSSIPGGSGYDRIGILVRNGAVGINTATPTSALTVVGPNGYDGLTITNPYASSIILNNTAAPAGRRNWELQTENPGLGDFAFIVSPAANQNPSLSVLQMHSNQTLTIPNYGAGAMTTDSSGNIHSNAGTSGQVLTSNGAGQEPTFQTASSSASLSGLTAATATNTLANANFAQIWNWDTLGANTAMTLATAHTSFTGTVFQATSSGNAGTSTGIVGDFKVTGAANAATGLQVDNAGVGNTAVLNSTLATSTQDVFDINSSSTSGQFGMNIQMNGATGAQRGLNVSSPSSGAPIAIQASLTGATNTGTILNLSTSGTGLAAKIAMSQTGAKEVLRLQNAPGTGAANDAAQLSFWTKNATVAFNAATIEGLTTTPTANGSGALVFLTANNAAATEVMRLDAFGHVIFTGTTPTIGTCGTGPSIAGNDNVGRITMGTGAFTACTITFANAWGTAPSCQASDENTGATSQAITATATTTGITFNAAGLATMNASDKITYRCAGF